MGSETVRNQAAVLVAQVADRADVWRQVVLFLQSENLQCEGSLPGDETSHYAEVACELYRAKREPETESGQYDHAGVFAR